MSNYSVLKIRFHVFLLEVNVTWRMNIKLEWIRAKTWHISWGYHFTEVSAKEDVNISTAFFELVHLLQAKNGKMVVTS